MTEGAETSECYQSEAKRIKVDPVDFLRTLPTIRARCNQIYEAGKRDELKHFAIHEDKLGEVVDYVHDVILSRFPSGTDAVPNHSRFRHFEPGSVDRLAQLRAKFGEDVDQKEVARRLVDLVMVSVLLDAGAGDTWKYLEESSGQSFNRSEGLGVASFHMFMDGAFSSQSETNKYQADSAGLRALTTEAIRTGFQVDDEINLLVGAEGRAELLRSLGSALEEHPEYFASTLHEGEKGGEGEGRGNGEESSSTPTPTTIFRPGYLVDYLFAKANASHEVSVHELWRVIMYGLESIWPSGRTTINGRSMGDVWPHSALSTDASDASSGYVPFHKLSQWLTYSLFEPLTETGLVLTETEYMTGLPEYRNGGLFVDLGVLVPKSPEILSSTPGHLPDSEVIVEWRALTVILLDETAKLLCQKVGASEAELPLVKVLEGGTWTAGRKIAKEKRPETCGPPIVIISDGTVF